jgi:predicted chitinase/peptidoglycan hydrolase-like protein with peptidoglycan-binding domain
MADKWHDINNPGAWQKPEKPESGSGKPADPDDNVPPEPQKPLVKLSEGKFVPPAEGAEINKKCPVQVNVEYLDDSAKSMQKVTFSLYANYKDATSNLSHYVDGFEKDGVAQAEMTIYPPPEYKEGDRVDYFFKAEHIRGEKVIDSEDLTLPMETQSIVLQKGDYDENGAAAYNKDQSGDNFKPNNVVKKLQGDLITTNFLPKGSDDGFFGDQTDKAVKDFQDYAIKLVRMKRSEGKTENTDKGLDQESPDGIAGEKTRDELDKWLSNNWVKPVPTLRHGEFDDTGVDNGKGKKGTEDHHQGTPVVEAQNNLQKVGVYTDGAVDGWFYDKMLDAVKQFQDAAAKGKFIINEVLTDIGEILSGHQKGEVDAKTQEFMKKVVDKGGKVPQDLITLEMLHVANPNGTDDYHNRILPFLNKYATSYEINTPERIAHFLSQIGHESRFKAVEEDLNYSEKNMKKVFGCKPGSWVNDDCPEEKRVRLKLWNHPDQYSRNPEKLGNYVYADRLGNGNEDSGEGYKYRGRGLIQLTGKANYQMFTNIHNKKNPDDKKDFVSNPELIVSELQYGIESAFVWWDQNHVNTLCNGRSDEDVKNVTYKVNGGYNGLEERKKIFNTIISSIKR